jgi:probable HAF family extracellular repeat protein
MLFAGRAAAGLPPLGYFVQDLGTLPGWASGADDISNKGWIVGSCYAYGHGPAFFRTPSVSMQPLLPGGAQWSVANGVNDWGQIAGEAMVPEGADFRIRAFLFWSGQSKILPLGTAGPDEAYDVNMAGWVAGTADRNGIHVAFVYKNVQNEKTWISQPFRDAYSRAINDNGDVAGGRRIGPKPAAQHAFVWEYISFWNTWLEHDLGTLGGFESGAEDINAKGDVVGWSDSGGGTIHAFLFKRSPRGSPGYGVMQNLSSYTGAFWGEHSNALGINGAGDVVGVSGFPNLNDDETRAVIWSQGKMVNLNTMIPSNAGWVLKRAEAINDNGQIVGSGLHNNQPRAFLLTPVKIFPLQP